MMWHTDSEGNITEFQRSFLDPFNQCCSARTMIGNPNWGVILQAMDDFSDLAPYMCSVCKTYWLIDGKGYIEHGKMFGTGKLYRWLDVRKKTSA